MATSAGIDERSRRHGPERSAGRDRVHGLLLALPWLLVAWLWRRVVAVGGWSELGAALAALGVLVGVVTVIDVLWVAHNVRIYRRKGPRTGQPEVARDYDHDAVDRPVDADWAAVRRAPSVVVDLVADGKRFLVVGDAAVPPPPPRAPARPTHADGGTRAVPGDETDRSMAAGP